MAETAVEVPQWATAMQWGNHIRTARSDLKRRIAGRQTDPDLPVGRGALIDALLFPRAEYEGMKLYDAIVAQEHWGTVRTRKFFRRLNLNELKTFGGLTDRQREVLADMLGRTQ